VVEPAAVVAGRLFDATLGCLANRLRQGAGTLRARRRRREAFAAAVEEARAAVLRPHPSIAADGFDEAFVRRAAPGIAEFRTLDREPDPSALLPEPGTHAPLRDACALFRRELETRLLAKPELAEHFGHRLIRRTASDVRQLLRGSVPAPAAPLPAPPPAAPEPFPGREEEFGRLLALLATHRLVLVRGGPGIGRPRSPSPSCTMPRSWSASAGGASSPRSGR
jgi:hypothetical protein